MFGIVNNTSLGETSVLLNLADPKSEVIVPPRTKHTLEFADQKSLEAAIQKAKSKQPQKLFIVKSVAGGDK